MTKPIVVKTTLFWANTNTVNDLSNKYQVNLGQLSEKAVEALSSNGIEAKNKGDEQGYFITVKSANPIRSSDADHLTLTDYQSKVISAMVLKVVQQYHSMTGHISANLDVHRHCRS